MNTDVNMYFMIQNVKNIRPRLGTRAFLRGALRALLFAALYAFYVLWTRGRLGSWPMSKVLDGHFEIFL